MTARFLSLLLVAGCVFTPTLPRAHGQGAFSTTPGPLAEIEADFQEFRSQDTDPSTGRSERASSAAAFALAVQLESEGRLKEALARFRQAAATDPRYLPAQARTGLTLLKLGRREEALAWARTCLADHPDSAVLMALRAVAHHELQQHGPAEEWARKSMDRDPEIIANYAILARAALSSGDPARIRALFQSARDVPSSSADYHARQAALWIQLLPGDGKTLPSQAAREVAPLLQKAASLDPENLVLTLAQGHAAFLAGNHASAIEYFSAVQKRRPHLPLLHQRLAECHLHLGQNREAIPHLEWLLDHDPTQRTVAAALAELHGKVGQWKQAADRYQQALVLSAQDPKLTFALAEAQHRSGDLPGALATLENAMTRFPQLPAFPYYRGLVLFLKGEHRASLEAYQTAEELALPGNAEMLNRDFYFRKALSAEKAGEFLTMELALRRCITMQANDHESLNFLGYALAERGERLDEAEVLIRQAVELEPGNGAYLDSLGWVYYQKGRYRHARAYLARAAVKMPDDPVILDHLGDAWMKLGNTREALAAWNRALAVSKEPEPIRRKIEQATERE